MNYTDEEVELIVAWNEKRKAFVAAKEARPAHPDDDPKAEEAYQSAKAEMSTFRAEWRGVREYMKATADEESQGGDAIVSPGLVGVPSGGTIANGTDTESEDEK